MKRISGVAFLIIMTLSLVSICEAGPAAPNDDIRAFLDGVHNTVMDSGSKDKDSKGSITPETQYPCLAGPSFTDYVDAREVRCPRDVLHAPAAMGSWQ